MRVIRLKELITAVFFKPTHTCCYIPCSSNHPRSIKLGWIKGEVVRFLRICSHKVFFDICVAYLRGALKRLGYPKFAYDPLPLTWHDKRHYTKRRGAQERSHIVHVVRAPHHSSVSISWSKVVRSVESKMRPFLPRLRLHVTLQPSLPLRRVFLSRKTKLLRQGELVARMNADFNDLYAILQGGSQIGSQPVC